MPQDDRTGRYPTGPHQYPPPQHPGAPAHPPSYGPGFYPSPYGHQPPAGYPIAPPAAPPRGTGKTIGIGLLRLGGVLLALIIAVAIFGRGGSSGNGGSSNSTSADLGGSSAATAGSGGGTIDTGPAFPGKKDDDVATAGGGTITIDGLSVTSTPLRRGDGTFGKTLCTTLTYANGGDKSARFGVFDFELQDPKGAIVNPTFFGGGDGLGSGELAPGGSVNGDVCFEDKAASKGLYIVFFEPSIWNNDRGAFLNQR